MPITNVAPFLFFFTEMFNCDVLGGFSWVVFDVHLENKNRLHFFSLKIKLNLNISGNVYLNVTWFILRSSSLITDFSTNYDIVSMASRIVVRCLFSWLKIFSFFFFVIKFYQKFKILMFIITVVGSGELIRNIFEKENSSDK